MSTAPRATKQDHKPGQDAGDSEHGEPQWSPMPFTGGRGGRKLSRDERVAYFKHLDAHPEYATYSTGSHRPTAKTAEAVWSLLAPRLKLKLDDFLLARSLRLPIDEVTAKQALVVAIDAAVRAGERGRMLTTNTVFDALGPHWSDHYRFVVDARRADISYDMKAMTVRAIWRDFLRNGVRLDALWIQVRRGHPQLYVTKRASGRGRPRGRTVQLAEDAPLFLDFLRVVKADRDYRRDAPQKRLLFAHEPLPSAVSRDASLVKCTTTSPSPARTALSC
jgi:hypothetical protein